MIAFTMIVPFMWMLSTSVKPETEILRRNIFPVEPTHGQLQRCHQPDEFATLV